MFELHSEFHQHVLAHLQLEPTTLKCEWDLCDFESDDCAIFQRHVGHHVYMTKLKTVGEQLLHKRPMPPCLITSRTRNLIPNTDTKYVCMWLDCTYTFDMVEDYYEHARSHCVHELEINKQGNRNKHVQCRWYRNSRFDQQIIVKYSLNSFFYLFKGCLARKPLIRDRKWPIICGRILAND